MVTKYIYLKMKHCIGQIHVRKLHPILVSFLCSSMFQRKALVVLFQNWFGAAAEEGSMADRVAVYLREVKKVTPALLAFMINLADDNGNTVLHYSVSHCNYSIVSLILDTGTHQNRTEHNLLQYAMHSVATKLFML